jgi:hypothetical protein
MFYTISLNWICSLFVLAFKSLHILIIFNLLAKEGIPLSFFSVTIEETVC